MSTHFINSFAIYYIHFSSPFACTLSVSFIFFNKTHLFRWHFAFGTRTELFHRSRKRSRPTWNHLCRNLFSDDLHFLGIVIDRLIHFSFSIFSSSSSFYSPVSENTGWKTFNIPIKKEEKNITTYYEWISGRKKRMRMKYCSFSLSKRCNNLVFVKGYFNKANKKND